MPATAAAAATQVKVTAVEDNPAEALAIKNKLQSSRMFACNLYQRYRGENVFEAAQRSDIVSLDLSVQGTNADSIKLANELVRRNPHQSLVFFTNEPQKQIALNSGQIVTLPGNFILGKYEAVWNAYDRLLLSIWIHDRCLALLKATNDYFYQNSDESQVREMFQQVIRQLRDFYPSLLFLIEEVGDTPLRRRYIKLRDTLHPILDEVTDTGKIEKSLKSVRRPLLSIAVEELNDIKNVNGVFTTTKLDNDIAYLRKSIYGEKFLKTRVFLYESLSSSLRKVNLFLKGERGFHRQRVGKVDYSKPPLKITSDVVVSSETLEEASGGGKPTDSQEATNLYLNAWFPDYVGKEKLVVGEKTDFLVNLGSTLEPNQMGISDPISEDESSLFETVDCVDVMVISPDADVVPLRNRLYMPPRPERPARFEVTPRTKGFIDLTVILTVLNEPIHRTVFSCEAEKKEPPEGGEP
jgi:hypothetical protein